MRLLLNWAAREGEEVLARPQLPRREKPMRDVLTRDEIDALERAMPNERDKLIIRIFADCGLRLDELTRLDAKDIVRSGSAGAPASARQAGPHPRRPASAVASAPARSLHRVTARRPNVRRRFPDASPARRHPHGADRMGVYQVVKDAFQRARITKHVYPHLLRHSWMTEMLRNGMNPIQLS